ncbi:MAG: hypothetical protein LIP01_09765, partial [Tannerellaceae bacterium]|nr:hypothetical protein [Tannerellaceae bacterium]
KRVMQTLKNVLIGIGVISLILFITFLVIGVRVISSILLYVVGGIAVLFLIGLVIFYIGKFSNRNKSDV